MKLHSKRILVTGGAGFIGGHLVEELARDNEVTVFDDFSVGTVENLKAVEDGIRIVAGDVRDRAAVDGVMPGIDVVFHLAVACLRVSISDPLRSHMVNDLGTLNLLLAAREHDVERFVYVSSSEVYGTTELDAINEDHPLRPMTPYAASKLAGELYSQTFHRTYGFPTMVVRPFNTYGPRAHLEGASGEVIPKFVARAMAGLPLIVFGDGMQTRDFTWVGDTVRGIRLAGECDALIGQCINIAHGEEISILTIANLVRSLVGSDSNIEHHPDRPGDVRRHRADVERSRRLLGFTGSVGIEAGLKRYVEWVKTLPGDPVSWLEHEEVYNWLRTRQEA